MKTPYLTSAQLGITPAERDGLIRIMRRFRTKPPVHLRDTNDVENELPDPRETLTRQPMVFTMEYSAGILPDPNSGHPCNTVACIGGHLALMLRPDDPVSLTKLSRGTFSLTREDMSYMRQFTTRVGTDDAKHPMKPLFYPGGNDGTIHWAKITPLHAADAIENFLRSGEPHWQQVMRARA